jgi:hypothetical protein
MQPYSFVIRLFFSCRPLFSCRGQILAGGGLAEYRQTLSIDRDG